MIMKKLWAYLYGYLIIVVKGVHPERFINLAITRGIQLWDLSWDSSDTLTVRVQAQSFRPLRHVARQTRCQIRIHSKRGLPFLMQHLRRRRMLFIGAVIFLLALYFLSFLIWTVDINGTSKLSTALVKELAAAEGLKPGNFCFLVSRDQVENYLMRQLPEISYVEVEVRPRATVKVVEKKEPAPSQGPCHIVAKKDGVIDSILALEGQALVKEGDLVKKGQILISGAVYPPLPEPDPAKPEQQQQPSAQKPIRFVNAQGVVYGKYWYRFYGEAWRDQVVEEKTGRQMLRYSIIMGDKEIVIKGLSEVPYQYYESRTKSKILRWRNQELPVEFVTLEAEEVRHVSLKRSYEEAIEVAVQQARGKQSKGMPPGAEPVTRKYKVLGDKDDNPVRVVLTVETKEEFGITRNIKAVDGSEKPDKPFDN